MRTPLKDRRGASLMEFAILAPVFLLLLFGGLDASYNYYIKSVLDGEVQKAARDFSLEDANNPIRNAAIQQRLREAVQTVMRGAQVDIALRHYHDYRDAAYRMEEFDDKNHNGTCDNQEPYVDANNNNHFDADSGVEGVGSSRDVLALIATASYPRLIISSFVFGPGRTVLTSTTMLRNQPASDQTAAPVRNCA